MGYYGIGALVLLAGGVGMAYVAFDHFGSQPKPTDETAVVEPRSDDASPADRASSSNVTGSAAHRMDDFGSGPSGTTVTVPLDNRHRQAYAGKGTGGGGPASPSDRPSSQPALDAAALDTAALSQGGEETAEPEPSFRVIERDQPENAASEDGNAPTVPTFDVVRVDPSGRTVMAGRAAPLTNVEIKADDQVIDRVTATATGEWVSTPVEPLQSGDQELSLTARENDGAPVHSRQIVVVSVPEAEVESQPVAVVVDKDEGGAGRILQAPDKLESSGDGRLALKLVDYDEEGAIRLSGEAPPGVPVRIYVDNEPAALVIGDSKGYWITTLDQDLPGGDYTLRLDQLDLKGQTIARLETPFTRVATPPVEGEVKVDHVVVQPGKLPLAHRAPPLRRRLQLRLHLRSQPGPDPRPRRHLPRPGLRNPHRHRNRRLGPARTWWTCLSLGMGLVLWWRGDGLCGWVL